MHSTNTQENSAVATLARASKLSVVQLNRVAMNRLLNDVFVSGRPDRFAVRSLFADHELCEVLGGGVAVREHHFLSIARSALAGGAR